MFDRFTKMITENGGKPTPVMVKQIIDEHKPLADAMKLSYQRYKGAADGVPIYSRIVPTTSSKVDNRLAHDWMGEIVDTKSGYMAGVPIEISVDQAAKDFDKVKDFIDTFKKVNSFDDFVAENIKVAAICGYDSALVYIDPDGIHRVVRMEPWECCHITENEITSPVYGLRYYTQSDGRVRADFYNDVGITVFVSGKGGAKFAEDPTQYRPHNVDYCPLYGVPNNAELLGDCDKILSLIDAYDRSNSDFNSEIEQFRLAYFLFYGFEPDKELIDEMIKTGAIAIPSTSKDDSPNKVEYLTKSLNHAAVDSHLDRLEANIIRFGKHVNFTDAAFGGDLTGPAMRHKMFMLEAKSKIMERKHHASMLYLFKVLGSNLQKADIKTFDYTKLDFKYTRNVPVNVLDEVNTAKATLGITSMYTTLSAMPSLVPDPTEEMARKEEESGEVDVDIDNPDKTIQTGTAKIESSAESEQKGDGSGVAGGSV